MEKLCATEANDKDIMDQYPEVFTGLSTFGEGYEIKLKGEATPYALYAPRNIPIPFRQNVQQELNRMEKLGVIRKVSEPTPWCADIVVTPSVIQSCVDLKLLNEEVLREIHPIPRVDDTLAQMAGAKILSQQWVLADTTVLKVAVINHIRNSLWSLLF